MKSRERMEEKCELCEKKATVYCNSDEAKLCWLCDARVHSANFLVARHIRVLLCRICNSHTQWKASGPKLIPSSSFCHPCVANGRTRLHRHVVYDDGGYIPDSDEDEDEEENKVVPLYSPSSPESSSASALKRHQDNSFSINSNVGLFFLGGELTPHLSFFYRYFIYLIFGKILINAHLMYILMEVDEYLNHLLKIIPRLLSYSKCAKQTLHGIRAE
ncbi:putative transcription factor interactor and regulator Znf-B family [Lupinus albus]|uniref:Putative transcription factor interactor and regulator Znf-B family n=1 Tax=Lupinus albus TaxID=3870 RepID=A0A6A4NQF6_LUPAL|nr:putative transcription factor interactor and regulator Znf-B family [Lupinus albus]